MPKIEKISGYSYTAIPENGKWYPARVDLQTGASVKLLFGFDVENDAIDYAMDNFS